MGPLVHGSWNQGTLESCNFGTPNLASYNHRALLPWLETESLVKNFELWNLVNLQN